MQLKMQTDYRIRILLYLASHRGLVSTEEMSARLGIKKTYLPKMLIPLRKEGLVFSETGATGGYRLVKSPEKITLLDVMKLSEDSVKINRCLEEDGFCSRGAADSCAVRCVFADYQDMTERYFGGITIADLLEENAAEKIRSRSAWAVARALAEIMKASAEKAGVDPPAGRE